MTEQEKMKNGQWYDANYDKKILQERLHTERLCSQYNQAVPGSKEQMDILSSILKKDISEELTLLAPVYFDYGYNVSFGNNVYVNHGCYFMDGAYISIGNHVFIGPYCGFYTATHPLTYKERNQGLEKALPIRIGSNCWIGANVSIMPGVTIGNGSVIATGSVVTKNIPDNCMAAGVPAVIKKRIEQ